MKMLPDHLNHLKTEINALVNIRGGWEAVIRKYEGGHFPNADKVKDLHTRLCWDCTCTLTPFICNELYKYLDDTHILTALKSFIPKPERKY